MMRPSSLRPLSGALRPLRSPTIPRAVLRFASTDVQSASQGVKASASDGAVEADDIDPQLQGYPQLPHISYQHRPPKGWWDQQNRRDFGEVLQEEDDTLTRFAPDVQPVSGWNALGQISIALTVTAGLGYLFWIFRPTPKAVPREYPYNGLEKEYGGAGLPHPRAESTDEEEE